MIFSARDHQLPTTPWKKNASFGGIDPRWSSREPMEKPRKKSASLSGGSRMLRCTIKGSTTGILDLPKTPKCTWLMTSLHCLKLKIGYDPKGNFIFQPFIFSGKLLLVSGRVRFWMKSPFCWVRCLWWVRLRVQIHMTRLESRSSRLSSPSSFYHRNIVENKHGDKHAKIRRSKVTWEGKFLHALDKSIF